MIRLITSHYKDKNKEREERFVDLKLDPDEENWWGPW